MISIELDKPRQLHFGLSGVRDLERALNGKPLGSIIQDLSLMSIDALVTALHHGLRHEDSGLNPNLILKMLDTYMKAGNSLQPVFGAVSEALEETGVFRTSDDVELGKRKTAELV